MFAYLVFSASVKDFRFIVSFKGSVFLSSILVITSRSYVGASLKSKVGRGGICFKLLVSGHLNNLTESPVINLSIFKSCCKHNSFN